MWLPPSRDPGLLNEYREDLLAHGMSDAVRRAALVVLALNMAFVGLDWFAFREEFTSFLTARLALNGALAVIYFGTARPFPVMSQSALCMATGGLLLWVIYGSGAPMGDYYAGLMLALVGLPVILPLEPGRTTVMWSVLVAAFVASPLFVAGPIDSKVYAIHSLFLASGAFTGIASSAFLTRFRVLDFAKRREIERANESLKETDRIKSRFTANIHHELRTPLTLTLAPLEAILSGEFGPVPDALDGYLRTMHANALRLLKLINNLLDLAKVEGQQFSLRRQRVNLAAIVGGIVDGARPLADRKQVALETDLQAELPVMHVDPEALEKVIVNLLGNALKFTEPDGRITIQIAPAQEGNGAVLVVADTGAGIPADQLRRIFDRFAQVDSSATRKHEGTGIGLSLVKELVELHEGRVWAESDGPGHGTRMSVFLPCGSADEPGVEEMLVDGVGVSSRGSSSIDAMAAEIELPGEGTSQHQLVEIEHNVARGEASAACDDADFDALSGSPEIVVVDDNLEMRRLLGTLLGRHYRVRLARNGREALDAVREQHPDLVVTDVMMPEMSGTELCAALKGDPETRAIPVMLVTSKADREMQIEGLEIGADDYVTKPFHPRELKARVASLLQMRALQNELSVRNHRLEATLVELQAAEVQLVQSERLAAVGELAAGVAHEMNNPVNFSLNAARALRSVADDIVQLSGPLARLDQQQSDPGILDQVEKLRSQLQELDFEETVQEMVQLSRIVTDGLERTGRLVGDLRDFTRSEESGHDPVDVRSGLEATVRLLEPAISSEDIRVTIELADHLAPVRANARALNQVFLNLMRNAIDALAGRGGAIEVVACESDGQVVIEIRDDGSGIPSSAPGKLFDPFVTTKGAGRGSGLGLAICRRIVHAHGGEIELVARQGPGSIARVSLPIAS